MKKTLLSLFTATLALMVNAQENYTPTARDFTDKPHLLLFESGTFTCLPCYTWTNPTFDYFKSAYGDSLILMKQEQSIGHTALASNVSSFYAGYYNLTPFGYSWGSPTLWLNQKFRYYEPDSIYRLHMRADMDSFLALPVIASPLFTAERIGTDSLVVHTYTKFLQNAPAGDYRVTVLLLQDSIYYAQNGAPNGMTYHMNMLHGPSAVWPPFSNGYKFQGEDSLCYTILNGTPNANSIFSKTFRFKLDTANQDIRHIKPLMLITRFDTAAQTYNYNTQSYVTFPRHLYVNGTVKEWDTASHITTTAFAPSIKYLAYLYPNPATNKSVKVFLQGSNGAVSLTMFDAMGRKVKSLLVKDGDAVSLQGLASGTYIYHLTSNNQIIAKQSIVIGD